MTAVTSAFVLRRSTAFLAGALSNLDVRRRILSAARRRLLSPADPSTLHALSLLSDTLDPSPSAATSAAYAAAASSVPSPLSALLIALSLSLRHRHGDAARSLLDLFSLDPAAARADIAPELFEELFLPHLFPAVRWFAERRARILAPEEAAAKMASLSRMSDGQAAELRELENAYEEVMDENSRAYADYLKELLRSGDEVGPPELVLPTVDGGGEEEIEGTVDGEEMGPTNGRWFNVMLLLSLWLVYSIALFL